MDPAQKADMRAYMSLANNILGNAEVKLTLFFKSNHQLLISLFVNSFTSAGVTTLF